MLYMLYMLLNTMQEIEVILLLHWQNFRVQQIIHFGMKNEKTL